MIATLAQATAVHAAATPVYGFDNIIDYGKLFGRKFRNLCILFLLRSKRAKYA